MINQELQPKLNQNGFDREGMDLGTPHGMAQARWDEMVNVSRMYGGTDVRYNATGESTKLPNPPSPVEETVLFNVTNSRKDDDKQRKKSSKTKTHTTKGLNGFWRGTLYRNGIPQPRKNGRGK